MASPPEEGPPSEETHKDEMNCFLYVLKNKNKNWHYIGVTSNLKKRLEYHNRGKVKSTRPYVPLTLVYSEKFNNNSEARKRENFLKRTARAREDLFEKIDLALSSNG